MAKKGGKYAAVIGKLPVLGIDPARRQAVEMAQEQIKAPLADGENIYQTGDVADQIAYIRDAGRKLVAMKKRQTAGKPWASEYARAYAECRAIREGVIAEIDGAFSLLIEAYQWLMINQMEVEGTTSLKLDSGASVVTFQEPQAKVEDPAKFLYWCLAPTDVCRTCGESSDSASHVDVVDESSAPGAHVFNPGGGMTNKLMLPWATTNALTKERLLQGEPEPDGVTSWAKTTVRLGQGDE